MISGLSFYAAEVVHDNGTIRPIGEVAGMGIAMDALEAEQLIRHQGEDPVADQVDGVLVVAFFVILLT